MSILRILVALSLTRLTVDDTQSYEWAYLMLNQTAS